MDEKREKIILVDDNLTNLAMGRSMLKETYEVYPASSGAALFEILEHVTPALILLDVLMPGLDGYQTIEKLKADPRWSDIPVIFLTSKNDEKSEFQGLSLGAIDYVGKPFSAPLLLKRLENQLILVHQKRELRRFNDQLEEKAEQKTRQVVELQNAVISTVAYLLEVRDHMTGGHLTRIQNYLKVMIEELLQRQIYFEEVSSWDQVFLIPSAQLHDVGRVGIRDAILHKTSRLTAEEFEEMKRHTTIGAEAVIKVAKTTREHAFLRHGAVFAGTHHERWDGKGYPAGLKGEEIPLEGRILAIFDDFDALVSDRPYRLAFPLPEAVAMVLAGRGTQFDPVLVEVFEARLDDFIAISKTNW
ncbi:MAG: response regulator [Deltaproteobacteria bacterium]|nr:response regulator [Deltaproteobacteria bacterium]